MRTAGSTRRLSIARPITCGASRPPVEVRPMHKDAQRDAAAIRPEVAKQGLQFVHERRNRIRACLPIAKQDIIGGLHRPNRNCFGSRSRRTDSPPAPLSADGKGRTSKGGFPLQLPGSPGSRRRFFPEGPSMNTRPGRLPFLRPRLRNTSAWAAASTTHVPGLPRGGRRLLRDPRAAARRRSAPGALPGGRRRRRRPAPSWARPGCTQPALFVVEYAARPDVARRWGSSPRR